MDSLIRLFPLLLLAACANSPGAATAPTAPPKPLAEILAGSPASDWRKPDPENTMYIDLPSGRVVIELAPHFAPQVVANIKTLVREKYFDGLAVIRAQDNYVAQWGDPAEDKDAKSLGSAKKTIAPEWTRAAAEMRFTALPDRDTYGEGGFSEGFPAARRDGRAWLVHCYAMVGVGRGNEPDSGNGSSLYAIIGSAARLLDRNITVAGRVIRGIELLSTLPRGTGTLGFYEKAEQRVPMRQVRMAADVPAAERVDLEMLRTDSATFRQVIESRRFRKDDWYKEPAGAVDVCNVPMSVRTPKK